MIETPLVSIIIPVYNVEQYLERCILSCIHQTYKNIEIIVINDGSPDHSQAIIDAAIQADNRISAYSQTNIGLGLTRNRGIDVAKGEYLFFLDSDDFLTEDAIEQLVKQVEVYSDIDIIAGNFIRIDSEGNRTLSTAVKECVIEDVLAVSINDRYHYFFDHGHILTFACNKLYSTNFIRDNHLRFSANNKIYAEDMLFNLKAFMCLPHIKISNIYTYFYYENMASITAVYKENMALRWSNLVNEYVTEMFKRNADDEFQNMIPFICGIALSNISYNIVKFKTFNYSLHRSELETFYLGTSRYYNRKSGFVLKQADNKIWSIYYRIFMKLFYSRKISTAVIIQHSCMKMKSLL